MELRDTHNRIANYLRIGVTDRCNLRCRYCMPEQGIDFADRRDILSYEEITRLAKIFKTLGVEKVRITGGEPFVRKDMGILLRQLASIFPKVHITTNATLLSDHIELLKELKIASLNISIDSLDRDKFFLITRRDSFDTVMENILWCIDASVPIKLNMVVMRGINDAEILDFVRFGIRHNIEVRFIEAMPFNEDDGNRDVFMSSSDILRTISEEFPDVRKIESNLPSSSEKYELNGGHQIGIIPAYTRSLCTFCNRIRLTPKGEFMTCLYATKGLDLRALLRDENISDRDLENAIKNSVLHKKKDGFEEEQLQDSSVFRSMTTIGG
ncbi:MAG: GTP 3',8-cyclase MoaA [Bacteroidota bacterium]